MDDITEELLKVDLNPPPLRRQNGHQNLLAYLNSKNYNELQEVTLDNDLYRNIIIQSDNDGWERREEWEETGKK